MEIPASSSSNNTIFPPTGCSGYDDSGNDDNNSSSGHSSSHHEGEHEEEEVEHKFWSHPLWLWLRSELASCSAFFEEESSEGSASAAIFTTSANNNNNNNNHVDSGIEMVNYDGGADGVNLRNYSLLPNDGGLVSSRHRRRRRHVSYLDLCNAAILNTLLLYMFRSIRGSFLSVRANSIKLVAYFIRFKADVGADFISFVYIISYLRAVDESDSACGEGRRSTQIVSDPSLCVFFECRTAAYWTWTNEETCLSQFGVPRYLCLPICAFGVITNVMHILVLMSRNMRHSAVNVILTAIAICDAGTMLSYLVYLAHFVLGPKDYCGSFMAWPWMLFLMIHISVSIALHTSSLWLAVGMAWIRLMTLRQGSPNSGWQKSQTAWKLSFAVYTSVIVLTIPTIISHRIEEFNRDAWHSLCRRNVSRSVYLNDSIDYEYGVYTIGISRMASVDDCIMYKANLWLTGIMFKVIPCAFLVVLSCSLLKRISEAEKNRRRLLGGGKGTSKNSFPSSTTADSNNIGTLMSKTIKQRATIKRPKRRRGRTVDHTTIMLVAILMVFLVTELPQGFVAILNAIFLRDVTAHIYQSIDDFMDLMSLLNASVNFVLYCVMSSRYRQTFWKVVLPRKAYLLIFIRGLGWGGSLREHRRAERVLSDHSNLRKSIINNRNKNQNDSATPGKKFSLQINIPPSTTEILCSPIDSPQPVNAPTGSNSGIPDGTVPSIKFKESITSESSTSKLSQKFRSISALLLQRSSQLDVYENNQSIDCGDAETNNTENPTTMTQQLPWNFSSNNTKYATISSKDIQLQAKINVNQPPPSIKKQESLIDQVIMEEASSAATRPQSPANLSIDLPQSDSRTLGFQIDLTESASLGLESSIDLPQSASLELEFSGQRNEEATTVQRKGILDKSDSNQNSNSVQNQNERSPLVRGVEDDETEVIIL